VEADPEDEKHTHAHTPTLLMSVLAAKASITSFRSKIVPVPSLREASLCAQRRKN